MFHSVLSGGHGVVLFGLLMWMGPDTSCVMGTSNMDTFQI